MADSTDPTVPETRRTNRPGSVVVITQKDHEEDMLELLEAPVRRKKPNVKTELPNHLERDLVQIFKLLSDETRLRILMYLYREGELHVSALCERLHQSQPAVSHHLALLREEGLIGCRRDGKHNFYSLRQTHFHRVMAELFQTIADPSQTEFRFPEFVLTPRRRNEA